MKARLWAAKVFMLVPFVGKPQKPMKNASSTIEFVDISILQISCRNFKKKVCGTNVNRTFATTIANKPSSKIKSLVNIFLCSKSKDNCVRTNRLGRFLSCKI